MNKKLYIKTYGCQMNEYDSNKITDILKKYDGYELTEDPNESDMILFNTCSIREKASEKVFSDLGRARKIKAKKPNLLIAVGGCVASQEGQAIIKRANYVDVVFGPQTLHRLPELIKNKITTGVSQVDISFPEIEKFDNMPDAKIEGVSAYISIMEGCSKFCTYCVVPYTRGKEVSRPVMDVITEIKQVVRNGIKEVHLLGQNVNAYRGLLPNNEVADFAMLLELIHNIPEVLRIRYTTSHPTEMNNRIIDCYAKLPKLVSHLHLPIQSGSDRVLALMKRGYTVLEYKSIIKKIRAIRPDISFSSDFIVGFPGESEIDFEKTLKIIDDVKFDTSFSFIFSPRPGTPASEMSDDTNYDLKSQRLKILQSRLEQYSTEISKNMIGSVQKVLVESISKRDFNELSGRTENYKTVNFAGNPRLIGSVIDIKITEALHNSLRGEVI